jgi:hypothetical protein
MNEAKIRDHLATADSNIKKGEKLIEKQEERREEMEQDGHPTKNSRRKFESAARRAGNHE